MQQNPVFGSLIENLESIQIIFNPTTEVFKVDRDSTADKKEVTVQEFIRAYLTSDFRLTKGHIFSQTDSSQSIDCVVLAPNHPRLITPKREVILAEGVFAAVEIKPDIYDKRELLRGLQQIRSVKKLHRDVSSTEFPGLGIEGLQEFQKKIPTAIFSGKSLTEENMYKFLKDLIDQGEFEITDLPDLILTLDNGLFVISPDMEYMPLGNILLDQDPKTKSHHLFNFKGDSTATTLALFLIHLLCFPTAYLKEDEPILLKYLTNLTSFQTKAWELK
ncbi:DUF6602 domain-containing protein [Dyadobacter psychrotolerans]|uniref:DUF6602 domain-containing protein n=1 Tax=Dyadobacter psychrotolerans TaxID=2541721 RepID=A0A4R5D9D5_9BACT|nr:DUF6602 domain-containing protein [Dyadobacter psychrotolerans]TDE08520.1 hypothetical protein E0F88_32335 [Dyadobacter psychrotolerans]